MQTLYNLNTMGFNIEAFIGIPYGKIDKATARILDYVSNKNLQTLALIHLSNNEMQGGFYRIQEQLPSEINNLLWHSLAAQM